MARNDLKTNKQKQLIYFLSPWMALCLWHTDTNKFNLILV